MNYEGLLSKAPWRGLTTRLSVDSYNIYLIHVFFLWIFTKGQLGWVLSERTGGSPWIGVPLTSAAVLACSWGLSFFLQKIPVVSRVLVTA